MQVTSFSDFSWLHHGFSSRGGVGSAVLAAQGPAGENDLNLGYTAGYDSAIVGANRSLFLHAVAPELEARLVTVRQVHSAKVEVVGAGQAAGALTANGGAVIEADGLITGEPGVMLGILVADCVPVLVADVKRRVVAAFHAGWRGTAAGIVESGISRMREEFGCEAEDLIGVVGPSIGACCYTVGEEVRGKFGQRFSYTEELFRREGEGWALDLWNANRRQMVGAGMRADRVTVVGECTACTRAEGRRKYFSYRAEGGVTGRAMGVIGMVEERV